ncbi:MAG TPA: hypothetical protein ENK16_07820, partial [Chromatiales bacterium]|nr:hypothetical protein [Chromatiales bacterium]
MSDRCARARRCGFPVFLSILLVVSVGHAADQDPYAWLTRMARAVEQLNYRGALVHMHDGDADILHIVHRVDNGQVTERITALDGAGREIIRDDDQVTCILPDQQTVLVEPRDAHDRSQSPLQGRLPDPGSFDAQNYDLDLFADGSVAGRKAVLLSIRPTDEYRYGYRIWLDEATGMPLKSQLRSADDTLEQIMFTEVSIDTPIDEDAVRPSIDTGSYNWQRAVEASPVAEDDPAGQQWVAETLPPGFHAMAVRAKLMPGADMPTRQIVYTDGLATVSVFIEMGKEGQDEGEGLSTMGATNAYT